MFESIYLFVEFLLFGAFLRYFGATLRRGVKPAYFRSEETMLEWNLHF